MPACGRILKCRPIDFAVVVPLAPLGDLAAHEQELFARVSPHKPQIGAQICELLPRISWHFLNEGTLSVNDLIVRKWKDELLREGVDESKRQLIVMMRAVNGITLDILERVVHPPHVPFVGEAKAMLTRRLGYTGPCS